MISRIFSTKEVIPALCKTPLICIAPMGIQKLATLFFFFFLLCHEDMTNFKGGVVLWFRP